MRAPVCLFIAIGAGAPVFFFILINIVIRMTECIARIGRTAAGAHRFVCTVGVMCFAFRQRITAFRAHFPMGIVAIRIGKIMGEGIRNAMLAGFVMAELVHI